MDGFELKWENHVWHNYNDERMIDWCIKNLKGHGGDNRGKYGFGCECDANEELDEDLRIGIGNIYPDHKDWEEWMSEINEQEIRFYFCTECEGWALDDDYPR